MASKINERLHVATEADVARADARPVVASSKAHANRATPQSAPHRRRSVSAHAEQLVTRLTAGADGGAASALHALEESLRATLGKLRELAGPRLSADTLAAVDQELLAIAEPFLVLIEKYFRAEVSGLEHMPRGPALVVGNHNAGITFIEPFFLGHAWNQYTNGRDNLRFLAHDAMVALPVIGNMLIKLGVVRAAHEAADAVLAAGQKVVVFPGGNYEAFRPFRERFRVDFGGKTGFARLALRHRIPIVPVLSVGGHETFFVLQRGAALARLLGLKKYLRSELCPLFLGLPFGIGFGPIFHLPLPAKITVEVGEPMTFDEYGVDAADDREAAKRVSSAVQARLQQMMDRREATRRWPVIG